jgi:hypothetical protein
MYRCINCRKLRQDHGCTDALYLSWAAWRAQRTVWLANKSWIRAEDLRVAAQRPGGIQNVIWTPHRSIFAKASPHRQQAIR